MVDQVKKYGKLESREHHVSPSIGRRIARDHVREFGTRYYPALERMEKRLKKKR
jgi:hypothetical protein